MCSYRDLVEDEMTPRESGAKKIYRGRLNPLEIVIDAMLEMRSRSREHRQLTRVLAYLQAVKA